MSTPRNTASHQLPIPGYYGIKRVDVISGVVMNSFREDTAGPLDYRARSAAQFVQYVVVPEVAVEVIMEDMGVHI